MDADIVYQRLDISPVKDIVTVSRNQVEDFLRRAESFLAGVVSADTREQALKVCDRSHVKWICVRGSAIVKHSSRCIPIHVGSGISKVVKRHHVARSKKVACGSSYIGRFEIQALGKLSPPGHVPGVMGWCHDR